MTGFLVAGQRLDTPPGKRVTAYICSFAGEFAKKRVTCNGKKGYKIAPSQAGALCGPGSEPFRKTRTSGTFEVFLAKWQKYPARTRHMGETAQPKSHGSHIGFVDA